ncbi:choice-of-anchor L domain-containing protein [Flavobacterium sp.]|uniref:choice-of-anchor L domain-containing protein n=1 Tax=Flavobacterium sp. TaxID=239 RepID=UPI003528E12F
MKQIYIILVLLTYLHTNAQITINNTIYTTTQLVDGVLVPSGSGVTISNVTFSGVYNVSSRYQVGYFSTATTTLAQMGFTDGVVLSTGNTSEIPLTLGTNPGSASQMSRNYTSCTTGEIRKGGTCASIINDLNILSGGYSYYNTAILEFDFVPDNSEISFRYIFGSEEYSDDGGWINYQCSSFNDKFGFLISGPGISGGASYTNDAKNIARLDNGSEVSINSVNSGEVGSSGGSPDASRCLSVNPDWVENTPSPEFLGTIDGTQLNGNTIILTAKQEGLTPGETYHIKLIVMDISDGGYDSVVYLEAGSFKSDCSKSPKTTGTPNESKVGIGTFQSIQTNWPNSINNGALVLDSKNKGFVITRLTTLERDAISAVEGMLIYNKTENCFQLYNGTTWNCIEETCAND